MGLETGRVLVVHKFIWRLNLEIRDGEQHGRVPGDIPSDRNPVNWCVQAVVCPCLKNIQLAAQVLSNRTAKEAFLVIR